MKKWNRYSCYLSKELINSTFNFLQQIEVKYCCKIVLAGFIGSRVIQLHNPSSDYDVRAIASGGGQVLPAMFDSFQYGDSSIEVLTHFYPHIESNLKAWMLLNVEYPTVLHRGESPLYQNDIMRSQLRLAQSCPIYKDVDFLTTHREVVASGMRVIEAIDYEYTRAYINFYKLLQGTEVNLRKYLYTVNEILTTKWLLKKSAFAPPFSTLCKIFLPDEVMNVVAKLTALNYNSKAKEIKYIQRNHTVNLYIEEQLSSLETEIADYYSCNGSKILAL